MDKKLCERCIHTKDSELHINSVCEVCYQVENVSKNANSYFIEKVELPECCGKCQHCIYPPKNIFVNQQPYCKASQKFDRDDRDIKMDYIRKNYLTKNTPKWCPMRQ